MDSIEVRFCSINVPERLLDVTRQVFDIASCVGDFGGVFAAVEWAVVVREDVLGVAVRGSPVGDCFLGSCFGVLCLLSFVREPSKNALGLFNRRDDVEPLLEELAEVSAVE